MKTKDIVKILDNHTTPKTKSIEFPYYLDVAREILKNIDNDQRIFNMSDMISFAAFVIRLELEHPIFIEERHIHDWQMQYVESEYIDELKLTTNPKDHE